MAELEDMDELQQSEPTEDSVEPIETEMDSDEFEGQHELGVYGPWWASPEKTFLSEDLETDVRNTLEGLRRLASQSDIAARRFEVEQTWEVKLFERGYQHLTGKKGGGFDLPGEDTRWGPTAQINKSNLLNCNITSKVHDILVGALCREVPRVQFLPSCPDNNPEGTAAHVADKYKLIYQRNNRIRALMRDIASKFCTDDRVVLLTAFWKDATQYGFDEDQQEPVSPEDATTPLGTETQATQNLGQPQEEDQDGGNLPTQETQEEAPQEEALEPTAQKRTPKGMELTWLFDKLSNKVPITSNDMTTMPWVQLFKDVDEAFAKAMFPFASERIKPEGVDSAEIELDRIARMNTNLAIQGKYVTGDSMQRLTTLCWTFMRPSLFYANTVKPAMREKLCQMFPDGCLLVSAGTEFMFARNCNMNDHLAIGHPVPEPGQNRRALLTNVIPIQKRLNDWMDLIGDFFVRTVPKRYYDQTAFDIELIQSQDNTPGGAIPFIAKPGTALSELMGTDPVISSQPAMPEFIKWFEGQLNEDISGAMSAIYGGATDVNTVGNAEIQRDQALGRINAAWLAIQEMFAECHRQAVKCAALNRKKDIDESVQGIGRVQVEIAKMRGNILCYPEYDSSFPESSGQKLARFEKLWESLESNPASAAILGKKIKNLKVLKDNLRFTEISLDGEEEYEKQQGEFQILCKTGPVPNPEIMKIQDQLDEHQGQIKQATDGMIQDHQNGVLDPNEVQQAAPQLDQMEQQIQLMTKQLQDLEKNTPLVSTVPVAKDKSENHAVEAQACYDWMNSPEGRGKKHGSPEDQEVFANIYLHWQEHMAMDSQLNPQTPSFKSENLGFTLDLSKAPPDVAAQVLNAGGFQTKADSFQQKTDDDTKQTVKQRTAPKVIAKLTRS